MYEECQNCKFNCPRVAKLRKELKEINDDNKIYRELVKKEYEAFKKNRT